MLRMDVERRTRRIFHRIHEKQDKDEAIFQRLAGLLSEKYLGVAQGFFKDKVCLDAGCGSNANAAYAMLAMGARKVYCLDLDRSIVSPIEKRLKRFRGRYSIHLGSVLSMDFPDRSFDFTHCNGVLHHATKPRAGFDELARVTKEGGMLYVSVDGKGGLLKDVVDALRSKYADDAPFRKTIDGLTPGFFAAAVEHAVKTLYPGGPSRAVRRNADGLKALLDADLVLTIQDRLQAPLYHEIPEAELRGWYRAAGFSDVLRLKRMPKFDNIRKYLSPFYHDYENTASRLLMGDGFVQLRGVRKSSPRKLDPPRSKS